MDIKQPVNGASQTINIQLLGRSYRIACPPEEADCLLDAASYLDQQLEQARRSGRIVGTDRLTLMVALNLAAEVVQLRAQVAAQKGDLDRLAGRLQGMVDSLIQSG